MKNQEMFMYKCYATDFFGEMTRVDNFFDQPKKVRDLINEAHVAVSNAKGEYGSWEGDVRINEDGTTELYLFTLPAPEECHIGVLWKQENNGDTFIYSPFELPWLSEFLMEDQGSPL